MSFVTVLAEWWANGFSEHQNLAIPGSEVRVHQPLISQLGGKVQGRGLGGGGVVV